MTMIEDGGLQRNDLGNMVYLMYMYERADRLTASQIADGVRLVSHRGKHALILLVLRKTSVQMTCKKNIARESLAPSISPSLFSQL